MLIIPTPVVDAAPEAPIEPMVILSVPLRLARLLRLSAAQHAAGIRPWAEIAGEQGERARGLLEPVLEAQLAVESAIRSAGHPINPLP